MGIEQNNTKYLAHIIAHGKSSRNVAYFIIIIVKSNEFDSIMTIMPIQKKNKKSF